MKQLTTTNGYAGLLRSIPYLAAMAACALCGCRTNDALSLWNDAASSKQALVEYVSSVTDEHSPDFIPPEQRIAVFDLDGTLFCETEPTYLDWLLFEHRVLDTTNYTATARQRTLARNSRENGIFPPLGNSREQTMANAYRRMSLDEFDTLSRKFMDEPQPGHPGMKRGEMFYRPMVQLVDFLVENGFAVYVISGTDRFLLRALVRNKLPVPPWRVIGSDSAVVAPQQNGADGLDYIYRNGDGTILKGKTLIKNLQMNKVTAIIREIGTKPVLSFGNSTTDASMANYVIDGNKHKALSFMVLCDDMKREHGNQKKADSMRKSCAENGWIPISMRDDWRTIYGNAEK